MKNFRFLSLKKRGMITLLMSVWTVICYAQTTCTLSVDVSGIGKAKGTLYAILYDKAGYLKDKLQIKNVKVDNSTEPKNMTFEGLQKDSYAVVLFLDENENGKTDKNEMGMPTEMIGFSNNAPCSYGPPSFQETEISLDGDKTIKVDMYYFHL